MNTVHASVIRNTAHRFMQIREERFLWWKLLWALRLCDHLQVHKAIKLCNTLKEREKTEKHRRTPLLMLKPMPEVTWVVQLTKTKLFSSPVVRMANIMIQINGVYLVTGPDRGCKSTPKSTQRSRNTLGLITNQERCFIKMQKNSSLFMSPVYHHMSPKYFNVILCMFIYTIPLTGIIWHRGLSPV